MRVAQKRLPHIRLKPARFKHPNSGLENIIVICKKGKNRKYGKSGDRRIWTRGKTYKAKVQTILFSDNSIVRRYYIMTNRNKETEIEMLDEVEFKQRFKIFTKVKNGNDQTKEHSIRKS